MAPVTDAIIEKIRKCLALANGRNATQGEMEVAMAKAKEIAMRYQIDIATVNVGGQDDSKTGGMEIRRTDIKIRSRRQQKYHRFIYGVFKQVFGVHTIIQGPNVMFVGEVTDIAICCELFPWLEDVFYSTYYRAMKEGRLQSCAASKNGVYMGLYQGILAVNKREEEKLNAQDKACWALVVRNKSALVQAKVEEEFPHCPESRNRALQTSARAWGIGFERGKQINLRQTNNGATSRGALSN